MNVEIGTEAAQFPEKEYINGIFIKFESQCFLPQVPMSSPLGNDTSLSIFSPWKAILLLLCMVAANFSTCTTKRPSAKCTLCTAQGPRLSGASSYIELCNVYPHDLVFWVDFIKKSDVLLEYVPICISFNIHPSL